MIEKLKSVEGRFEELNRLLSDPRVLGDQSQLKKLAKEHALLAELVGVYHDFKEAQDRLEADRTMLSDRLDPEFKEMVEAEVAKTEGRLSELRDRLKVLLLPRDPNDEKNVIVEIRAGAGGDEAALFAADLARMYMRYAERQGWGTEVLTANETGIGGYKELIFVVEGEGAYGKLKYESGVHRVQRVPATESSGRIHTSTATVAILPEAEEVDVDIDLKDLRIDVFCSGGKGGQSVNTTYSAVRLTHLPTGLVVSCQDERSQVQNREKAMRVLRARLRNLVEEKHNAETAQARRSQVGTGDRSERIRTYNFPDGRVTDHRIGMTIHRINQTLDGELDEFISGLTAADQESRLRALSVQ
ncbi:MAG: peptide chain release factor 1 [Bacillota bacterium]